MAPKKETDIEVVDHGPQTPAVRGERSIVVPDSETMRRFLAAGDEVETVDADQVTIDIMARILSAKTVDEVLGESTALNARDVLDEPLVLRSVKFNKSDFDESGPGFYAVLDVVNEDGEQMVVTCGAAKVMAQAWRLADLDALPLKVTIHEHAKATARGYKPMTLAAVPPSF